MTVSFLAFAWSFYRWYEAGAAAPSPGNPHAGLGHLERFHQHEQAHPIETSLD